MSVNNPEIAKNKSYWLQKAEELFMPEFAADPANPTVAEKKHFYGTYPESSSLYMDLAKRIMGLSVTVTARYKLKLFRSAQEMIDVTTGSAESDELGVTTAVEAAVQGTSNLLGGAAYTVGYNAYLADSNSQEPHRMLDSMVETYLLLTDETQIFCREDGSLKNI